MIMQKPFCFHVIALIMLTACTSMQPTTERPEPVDAATLERSLTANNQILLEEVEKISTNTSSNLVVIKQTISDIKQQLLQTDKNESKIIEINRPCADVLGNKFVLGELEYVYVDEFKTHFETRIDTGAASSSIDAHNIILFERDGDQWVRFDVFTKSRKKPAQTFEFKVERFVRIKQNANTNNDKDRRPVIRAHLKIGEYTAETDLNLTNRSNLDYQLLLGRKFIKDIAVVDVSQRYIHGKLKVSAAN